MEDAIGDLSHTCSNMVVLFRMLLKKFHAEHCEYWNVNKNKQQRTSA